MTQVELLGFVAAALTTGAFFPQAIKIWRTGKTDGISLPTYAVFTTGIASWLVYGLLLRNGPIIAANIITLIPAVAILTLTASKRARSQ
ncbi:MAG: SemiSWEET transporter [Planctomycetota bacterium]